MKKVILLLLSVLTAFLFAGKVAAVDYTIESYKGDLQLHSDNTADFIETVEYHFSSDYKGQLITLGTAGRVPLGFGKDGEPTIVAQRNGQYNTDISVEAEDLSDGYKYKIYNAGKEGDRVTVTVTWRLKNVLFVHNDIVELNWVPISDWDEDLEKVDFTVTAPSQAEESAFYAHTGYFGKQATVKKLDNSYWVQVDGIGDSQKLEFHAYWSRSILANSVTDSASTGQTYLPIFQKTEQSIKDKTKFNHAMVGLYLPLVFVGIALLSAWAYLRFYLLTKPSKSFAKNARLYEAPQDLPPLVLAANVYAVDMSEVNPAEGQVSVLKFENLVQATILDLIDRGHLAFSGQGKEASLNRVSEGGIASWEAALLRMAMGGRSSIPMTDLFSDYELDEGIYKKGEGAVRKAGSSLTARFKKDLKNIDQKVAEEIKKLGLRSYYRSLTKPEIKAIHLSIFSLLLLGLLSIASFLFYGLVFDSFQIQLFIPFLLVMLPIILIYQKMATAKRDGVVSDEAAEDFYHWQSFANMLKTVADLDETEVEGVILWNRLLVYATLYGYADRVSKVMKIRKIQLENPSMNAFVYHGYAPYLYTASHNMVKYGHSANSASNFSVSSGGSGGGGFSGGGGGGGGGSF